MSEDNGAAQQSRAQRIAHLGRELAAKSTELQALAVWAEGVEERQARLEIVAAACEEERELMSKGVIWLSE